MNQVPETEPQVKVDPMVMKEKVEQLVLKIRQCFLPGTHVSVIIHRVNQEKNPTLILSTDEMENLFRYVTEFKTTYEATQAKAKKVDIQTSNLVP